jgi:hypothetical protein
VRVHAPEKRQRGHPFNGSTPGLAYGEGRREHGAEVAHASATEAQIKYRRRKPTYTPDQFAVVSDLLAQGLRVGAIAYGTLFMKSTLTKNGGKWGSRR